MVKYVLRIAEQNGRGKVAAMKKNSIDEMEQIQKGLESFLEEELHQETGKRVKQAESYAQINENENLRTGEETKTREKSKDREKAKVQEKSKVKEKSFISKVKKFIVILAVILVLGAVLWYFLVGHIYGKMKYQESAESVQGPLKSEGVTNILLIGSDARGDEEGRSDAMILLSISDKRKEIHMTSLLRDMYVKIPGHDGNRLNAAYAYGGPELLMATIEQNFDIEVNHYVVVNFYAFANLVDAVGGIELELSNEEVQWVNAYLNEYNLLLGNPIDTNYLDTSLSGVIHLNGPQALAYSRNRYIGTDFGRTERQRKVLTEIIKKAPLSVLTNAGELMNGLLPNMTTNLTQTECYLLSFSAPKIVTYDIVQGSIPQNGTYTNASIRGMAVLEVDFEKNKEYIQNEIYNIAER